MFLLLGYALRHLRENPGFAATAILTLALGIGSSTAILAVLDAVLLEPLPFAQPERLVEQWLPSRTMLVSGCNPPHTGRGDSSRKGASAGRYPWAVQDHSDVFRNAGGPGFQNASRHGPRFG